MDNNEKDGGDQWIGNEDLCVNNNKDNEDRKKREKGNSHEAEIKNEDLKMIEPTRKFLNVYIWIDFILDNLSLVEKSSLTDVKRSSSTEIPPDSPLEIIGRWMLTEERRAFILSQRSRSGCHDTDSHMLDLPSSIEKTSFIYKHLPAWIKCVIIITRQDIVIHKAKVSKYIR